MSLKVLVDQNQSLNVRVREGEKNGRKWRMSSQKVWIYKPGATFPEQFEITLPDGAFAYQPGEYALDFESMLERGQFDALAVSTRNGVLLTPVQVDVAPEAPAKPLFDKSNRASA